MSERRYGGEVMSEGRNRSYFDRTMTIGGLCNFFDDVVASCEECQDGSCGRCSDVQDLRKKTCELFDPVGELHAENEFEEARAEMMEFSLTARGFEILHFDDYYKTRCSIQQSSAIAEDSDDAMSRPGSSALWIGVDDPNPQCMASDAAELGVKTEQTSGWVPYPLDPRISISTRMHLTRHQARVVAGVLLQWARDGKIKEQY